MVTVRLLAIIKEKKFARHRSPKKYQDFEAHCHTVLAFSSPLKVHAFGTNIVDLQINY